MYLLGSPLPNAETTRRNGSETEGRRVPGPVPLESEGSSWKLGSAQDGIIVKSCGDVFAILGLLQFS